jgi:hypothetical protein
MNDPTPVIGEFCKKRLFIKNRVKKKQRQIGG